MQKIVKGLNGNGKTRRAEYRQLQKQYGVENVHRIDNPKAKCKLTRVEITMPDDTVMPVNKTVPVDNAK